MNLQLVPHLGVGRVLLGMSRGEAYRVIAQAGFGERGTRGATDTFLDAAFQITFDSNDCVEFIELANSATFSVTYNACDIFGTPGQYFASVGIGRPGYFAR